MGRDEEQLEALARQIAAGAQEAIGAAGQEALIELVEDGLTVEEAQGMVVDVLDAILAWKLFLDEPLASVLEAGDGPAIAQAISALPALVELLKREPSKIEARADKAEKKGHVKLATRRRERAARIRARKAD